MTSAVELWFGRRTRFALAVAVLSDMKRYARCLAKVLSLDDLVGEEGGYFFELICIKSATIWTGVNIHGVSGCIPFMGALGGLSGVIRSSHDCMLKVCHQVRGELRYVKGICINIYLYIYIYMHSGELKWVSDFLEDAKGKVVTIGLI
jgi:hypothetical protein